MLKSLTIGTDRLAFVESKIGRQIPADLLSILLLGHRALVAIEPEDEITSGGIVIPKTAQNPGGAGYFLKVGYNFGDGNLAGTANYDPWFDSTYFNDGSNVWENEQKDLLGRHCTFGLYSGRDLRVDVRDRSYSDHFTMLHAKDIWFLHDDEDGFKIEPKGEIRNG